MQLPIWLYWPGPQGRHSVWSASGCVPGGHALHAIPSGPISLRPQPSQKVEKSANVHWLPVPQGFPAQLARVTHAGVAFRFTVTLVNVRPVAAGMRSQCVSTLMFSLTSIA